MGPASARPAENPEGSTEGPAQVPIIPDICYLKQNPGYSLTFFLCLVEDRTREEEEMNNC